MNAIAKESCDWVAFTQEQILSKSDVSITKKATYTPPKHHIEGIDQL